MEQCCVEITPLAVNRISRIQLENGISDLLALRIDLIGGASSGFAYDLFFDTPQPDDAVVDVHGIRILLRPDSRQYLEGIRIDWAEGDNGSGFILRNPNEPEK